MMVAFFSLVSLTALPLEALPACTVHNATTSSDRPGNDLRNEPIPTAEACAAACCQTGACVGWVFSPKAPEAFGTCSFGSPCCYLKSKLSELRPNVCCSTGVVNHQTSTINITVSLGVAVAHTSRSLVSFNFDWHPGVVDPSWDHNASAMTIDLHSPLLRAAAAALAPGHLRIGGSQGDMIVYDVEGDGCGPASGAPQPVQPAFCLSMGRWRELVAFAQDSGVRQPESNR